MADIKVTDLIHAGLPWSNPEKITVKSDQYISQMVINRGLLNLLSNDYYLDLKAQRINQFIENVIMGHITDISIHHTEEQIIEIIKRYLKDGGGTTIYELGRLTSNTVLLLPIYEDPSTTYTYIRQIIQKCPKNLNGYCLMFAFSIPVSRMNGTSYTNLATDMTESSIPGFTLPSTVIKQNENVYNVLNLSDQNISFDSFYGGTLIVTGNDLFFKEDTQDGIINYDLLFNTLSKKSTRLFYEYLQKKLVETDITEPSFKLIGTGRNNKFSVLSFRDCNADTYLYNLNIQNNGNSTQGDQTESITNNMPQYNDLVIYYPANIRENTTELTPQYFNDQVFENNTSEQLKLYGSGLLSAILSGTDNNQSATNLNKAYLYSDKSTSGSIILANNIRNIIYGKHYRKGVLVDDTDISGSCLAFWIKYDFNGNDCVTFPILYDCSSTEQLPNGNGLYVGLQKSAVIQDGTILNSRKIETSYNYDIKQTSRDGNWIFFCINFDISGKDQNDNKTMNITIDYQGINDESLMTLEQGEENLGKVSEMVYNDTSEMRLFGFRDYKRKYDRVKSPLIRNIMFFNRILTNVQKQAVFKQGIIEYYPWKTEKIIEDLTNAVYSSVYVYNTNMLNVINCYLIES